MKTSLTRTEIIRCYLMHVLVFALFGAFAAWGIMTLTFAVVAHSEGFAYSPFAWEGFLTIACGVGAFIGGASGVETGQIAAYDKDRTRKAQIARDARIHPSVRTPEARTYRSEAECDADPECEWMCGHLADRLNGPARGWTERPYTSAADADAAYKTIPGYRD